jgi:uncharacterized protein
MKKRKIPLRSCIITKEKCPKKDLIRVVKDNMGNVFIDHNGKANGRGAYLKKDIVIIKKAREGKYLDKELLIDISDEIYEELELLVIKN